MVIELVPELELDEPGNIRQVKVRSVAVQAGDVLVGLLERRLLQNVIDALIALTGERVQNKISIERQKGRDARNKKERKKK